VENIKYAVDVHLLEFNVQEYVAASSSVGVLFSFVLRHICVQVSLIYDLSHLNLNPQILLYISTRCAYFMQATYDAP